MTASDKISKVDKVEILKGGLSLVTGMGVGKIVGGAVQMVAPQTTVPSKLVVYVAKFGISGALAAAVDAHNNHTIDMIVDAVKRSSEQAKNAK